MNILIVIPNFEPAWRYGGVMKSAVFLARGLHALGMNVTVYTMNTAGPGELLDVPLGTKVTLKGVDVFYFKPSIFRSRDFHSRELIRRMKQTIDTFDFVYISAMWQYVGVAAAKVAAQNSVPFILAPHGSFAKIKMQSKSLKKRAYIVLFLRRLFQQCHAIHFCSEYERRTFAVKYAKPYLVVPNAVDDFFFDAPAIGERTEGTHATGPSILLTAGRPDPIKGFDLSIETLSILRRQGQDVRLKILGIENSRYGDELKSLASDLGVSDAIDWRPFVSGPALIKEFLQADAYISMGRDENFCIAAAEALCLGIPVVCAETVGIGDLVEAHSMGTVCTSDPANAADAVCATLAFSDAARNDIKAQAKVLFRKEGVALQFLEAWQGVFKP